MDSVSHTELCWMSAVHIEYCVSGSHPFAKGVCLDKLGLFCAQEPVSNLHCSISIDCSSCDANLQRQACNIGALGKLGFDPVQTTTASPASPFS